MTIRSILARIFQQEDLNFLLTNRIPRLWVTRFIGWFSKVENPLVREVSLHAWRLFSDLDLSDAKHSRFRSMHECFTRELKPGARPIETDPGVLVSPCDAVVGACGRIDGTTLIQAKGSPYTLADLLSDERLVRQYRDGTYVTLRLKSSMYHRFHAPHDCSIDRVTYISGDTWNVNPIALKRIEKLFCKNERVVIETRLAGCGRPITLTPIAAILVASVRLHFLDVLLHLKYRGPNVIPCKATVSKGQELGWFEHGSTIIVFAPADLELCDLVREGETIRMGQPLLRLPATAQP
jgi:phosphatidylserine decarboxylase